MTKIQLIPFLLWCLFPAIASAQLYPETVLSLSPTHYFRLNELDLGSVADIGTNPTNGAEHEGNGLDGEIDPPIEVGELLGQVGYPLDPLGDSDPFVNRDGDPFLGLESTNVGLFHNDGLAVNLGPGTDFADPTMTVAFFFRAPCNPEMPGQECTGEPASSGGERLFSNNFPGQNTGGATDIDDLGHLQVDFGSGANLVISIDNNFSEPLKSNFQVAHGDLVVKDNNWHHIVVSRNGDRLEDVILVVNGEEITQDRWVDSTDSWGVTEPFDARIGTRTTAPHPHTFNGWMDEVSIWLGRQLTVEESISLYEAAIGIVDMPGDCNGDGIVDALDLQCACGEGIIDAVLAETGLLRGDLNGDGEVGFQDFVTLSSNFGTSVESYTQGDLDCDGTVAFQDFVSLSANFGKSSSEGVSAVPEPVAGTWSVFVGLALLSSRRNSRRSSR